MSLERIGLFYVRSGYDALNAFTDYLAEALRSIRGVEVSIFQTNSPDQLFKDISIFDAQAYIVLNSLFKGKTGGFICDYIKRPMIYYIVDTPFHFDNPDSPFLSVACIDRGHCNFLLKKGYDRTLFVPHCVNKSRIEKPDVKRKYGCVMLSSGIDYEKINDRFFGALPEPVFKKVKEAFEKLESDPLLLVDDALSLDLPAYISRNQILRQIDLYLKGKERVQMLKEMEGIPIDLFGGGDSWEEILGNQFPHVTVHKEIPFLESIEILKNAKIVLNSCSSIRDGAHERIFLGLACGASIATAFTPYLDEEFKKDEGIVFHPSFADMKEKIALWLKDDSIRCTEVTAGQQRIEEAHLWKHRAAQLYAALYKLIT